MINNVRLHGIGSWNMSGELLRGRIVLEPLRGKSAVEPLHDGKTLHGVLVDDFDDDGDGVVVGGLGRDVGLEFPCGLGISLPCG